MDGRFFTPGSITPVRSWEHADAAPRISSSLAAQSLGSLHDPPLEPRDEAVFLLSAAAEIEHVLMVQYLYAAYSVRVEGPDRDALQEVQDLLAQIAREEMGHLATVQNLLHLVGGPLNLGREHSPYASAIYPFRFALEPVTLDSLAKYVTAESPAVLPATMSAADRALVERIRGDATRQRRARGPPRGPGLRAARDAVRRHRRRPRRRRHQARHVRPAGEVRGLGVGAAGSRHRGTTDHRLVRRFGHRLRTRRRGRRHTQDRRAG